VEWKQQQRFIEQKRDTLGFNGSPLFTGDAAGGESEIRRWIIENDRLEAIVALPEQLFFNTGISTYLWVLTNRDEKPRKGKVQLIDAHQSWVQMGKGLGNIRHRIGDPSDKEKDPDHIGELTKIVGSCRATGHRGVSGPGDGAVGPVVGRKRGLIERLKPRRTAPGCNSAFSQRWIGSRRWRTGSNAVSSAKS
jgi:hypothetical protein